jgi:hypothetical protein
MAWGESLEQSIGTWSAPSTSTSKGTAAQYRPDSVKVGSLSKAGQVTLSLLSSSQR